VTPDDARLLALASKPGAPLGLRLGIVAAFPFPLPQGSQVYVAEQARALSRAGAEVTLLCYGHGQREDGGGRATLDALRSAGVSLALAPAALSRTPLGAGPSARKPLADAALLATLLAAERHQRFDAILAHNVEAACVALAARALSGTPVVFVAHTLLGGELPTYAPIRLARAANAVGRQLDRQLARRADAIITLSAAAETALRPMASGPLCRIAPALEPVPPPSPQDVELACRSHGLAQGRFAVYAGNLDAYQDLALLADAARTLRPDEVVVVTHDPRRSAPPGLRGVRTRDTAEARALLFGASLAVVPRRVVGGFPIKLLNYMEAGRAIVGFEGVMDGFTHGVDAWLLPRGAGPDGFAAAIRHLHARPALAAKLGAAARGLLEARFGWSDAAARTLGLVAAVVAAPRAPGLASLALRVRGGG
jgi:glycosyltransferase involved in cell wall biosynthesis